MKRNTTTRLLGLLTAMTLLWAASPSTFAAGTASGTTVSNQASLSYSIGGVSQPTVSSDDPSQGGAADPTTFLVDNKVDLTVTNNGNPTVIPGSNDQVMPYIPDPDADGVDSSVTHIRVNPQGAFNGGSSFQMTYRVQVE